MIRHSADPVRDAHRPDPVRWQSIRSVMARCGDVTPVGQVESIDLDGALRLATLTIAGRSYVRGYDDLIDVAR